MSDKFLDKVYEARDATAQRDLYDKWADSYEAEVGAEGYATPARCAEALAKHSADLDAPILDFGCGTGLSGQALHRAGFTVMDGIDISADMLAEANKKGVYRKLTHVEPDEPFFHLPGNYAAIAAIGVIGAGAAPVSVFDKLMKGLDRGGLLAFSFNDHTLQDPANEGYINEWLDCGPASLLVRENGPHLPGLNMKSTVYVVEKK